MEDRGDVEGLYGPHVMVKASGIGVLLFLFFCFSVSYFFVSCFPLVPYLSSVFCFLFRVSAFCLPFSVF